MRRTSTLTALAVLALGLVGATPVSQAASTVTTVALSGGGFAAMAVDETRDRIFVAHRVGGLDVVSTATKTLTETRHELTGIGGLAMTTGDTHLAISYPTSQEIVLLDAATLAETARYATGEGRCPNELEVSGPVVWFGYGCGGGLPGGVGRLDLSAETPTAVAVTLPDLPEMWSAPLLQVAAGAPHRLLVSDQSSGSWVRVYDTSGDDPLVVAARDTTVPTRLGVVLSADGEHVLGNAMADAGLRMSGPALADNGLYAHGFGGAPLSASPDGRLVAAVGSDYETNTAFLTVFAQTDSGSLNRIQLRPHRSGAQACAITWDATSSTVYTVLSSSPGSDTTPTVLSIVGTAAFGSTSVSLSGPTTATRAQPLTLTGKLTFAGRTGVGAPRPLNVWRVDQAGTKALTNVWTAADGTFTIRDTPPVGGTNTYHARYNGDELHARAITSRAVAVSRVATSIAITMDKVTYNYREPVRVTVRLGPTYTNRKISVHRVQSGSSYERPVGVYSGTVDAQGYARFSVTGLMNMTYIASFAGDHRYAPAKASRRIAVRARFDLTMSGEPRTYYAKSGAYHLYSGETRPRVNLKMWHVGIGWNIPMQAQYYSAGAWRPMQLQWPYGIAVGHTEPGTGYYTFPRQPRGRPARARMVYAGGHTNAASTSAWIYFRATS